MKLFRKSLPIGQYLLIFYLLSLFTSHLIFPPLFDHHFQLSEWIFLLLVGYHWPLFTKWSSYKRFIKVAWPLLLYVGVLLLSMGVHPSLAAGYKVGGTLYLFLLAFLFFHKGHVLFQSMDLWLNVMGGLAMLIIFPLLADLVFIAFRDESWLGLWRVQDQAYPYIGLYFRPQGWHYTPTMLLAVLALPFFSYYIAAFSKRELSRFHWIVFMAISLFVFLTMSKDLLFLFALLWLPWAIKSRSQIVRTVYAIAWISLLALQQWLTCFVPQSQESLAAGSGLVGKSGCIDTPAFTMFHLDFYETYYYLIRHAQFHIWDTVGFWGLGLGSFPLALSDFQPADPRYQGCYEGLSAEPHQTFLGAFFEMGVPGFVAVCLLFAVPLFRLWKSRVVGAGYQILFVILAFYALMGFSTDVEDFRPLWVILGLSFGVGHRGEVKETTAIIRV